MIKFKIIKNSVERRSIYPYKRIILPIVTPEQWRLLGYRKIPKWFTDYQVFMDHKERAKKIVTELGDTLNALNYEGAKKLIKRLRRLRVKPYMSLSPIEVWRRDAFQIVNYAVYSEVFNTIVHQLEGLHGKILEAMCGSVTYLNHDSGREVTMLDYCKQSLERLPCGNRKRIQCDLNQVSKTNPLPFFGNDELDAVSICFGYKYIEGINPLLNEFWRILKPGGKLSFIEHLTAGYGQFFKRQFVPHQVVKLLIKVGFSSVTVERLKIEKWGNDRGRYYFQILAVK